jgi:hypothetical protein
MRINMTALQAGPKSARSASETAGAAQTRSVREPAADNVTVSPRGRLLVLAREALDAAPEVRRAAIDAARDRLSGEVGVGDGKSIARAMIDTITIDGV